MSRKLTKTLQDDITRAVIKKVITPKEEELEEEKTQCITAYLKSLHGADAKTIEKIPRDYLYCPDDIGVKLSNGTRVNCNNSNKVPAKANSRSYYGYFEVDILVNDNPEWFKAFSAIQKKGVALADRRREIVTELSAIFASCKTVKQLEVKWPDVHKYIIFDSEKSLPAVIDLSKLNSLLNN